MGSPNFSTDDFDFSIKIREEEGIAIVDHLKVNRSIRENGYGSVIIETLKRVSFQNNSIEEMHVQIAGGEIAEEFLESNGFEIVRRNPYNVEIEESEGSYGVEAIYNREWISEDYN